MPHSISPEDLRAYFNSLIGKGKRFETNVAMADFLGLGKNTCTTLYNFLKGANSGFTSVLEWFSKLGGKIALPDERLVDFELVPRARSVAGAGESFDVEDGIGGMYAFRREFLERIHVSPKNAVMMYVSGDSMTPLICDGDTLLFDTKDVEPREGFIYVCSFGDALMVKRLQMIPGGWQLCSENRSYSPTPIQGDDLSQFRVYGRVRWFGRII